MADLQHRETAPLEIPAEAVVAPLTRFTNSQAASGILLAIAAIAAITLANSPFRDLYFSLNHLDLGLSLGGRAIEMSLKHWINDGLMVLFFFLLGLEIKRELLAGELNDPRQSSLVFCMAAGGMVLPASVYLGIVSLMGEVNATRGWGIPMATDAAFALGILTVLGSRVPKAAMVLLAALAIVDDIGAVMVISLFYTDGIQVPALIYAGACMLGLLLLNISGYRQPTLYFLLGIGLWWFILSSGVHATTAGVLAALAVPSRPYAGTSWFLKRMPVILRRFREVNDSGGKILETPEQEELIEEAKRVATATVTPLQRWERTLDKPVSLLIVPVFAFLNAGVELPGSPASVLSAPVSLAVAGGLVVGKVLGVSLLGWAGIALGIARMPAGINVRHLIGLGFLSGVGFTMSLFINALAFETAASLQTDAKLGILFGSLIAAVTGTMILLTASENRE